jgi:UDP-N-acetylglucosamine acyltransferase
MIGIHPTAIVDPSARIGEDVEIGPYTIVEADAQVGQGCRIGAHVTLGRNLRLGRRVRVFNYACLGTMSQDLKHMGEVSFAEIGNDVIVREFVTVNRGTCEGGVTRISDRAVLMAYSHVAHECVVEEEAILVNAANLGGQVHIGRRAMIGGLTGVHQSCRVGAFTIVGAKSKLTQDVPPYLVADGHPARPFGPNVVGLRRAGFTDLQIQEIRGIYRRLFDRSYSLKANFTRIQNEFPDSELASLILEFCQDSVRGIARPRPRLLPITDTSEFISPD